MDVDRLPALIESADPAELGHENPDADADWADLTTRYTERT